MPGKYSFAMERLMNFTLRIVLLGFILSMIYALFPPRKEMVGAVKLGFLSAVLITGILLLMDYSVLFSRKLFSRKRNKGP